MENGTVLTNFVTLDYETIEGDAESQENATADTLVLKNISFDDDEEDDDNEGDSDGGSPIGIIKKGDGSIKKDTSNSGASATRRRAETKPDAQTVNDELEIEQHKEETASETKSQPLILQWFMKIMEWFRRLVS